VPQSTSWQSTAQKRAGLTYAATTRPERRIGCDPAKADENLKRHKVSFDEAASVFTDPFALTFDDADHDMDARTRLQ